MANNNVHYIRGKAFWAKIIGAPRKNNFDDYREWTIDVSPDADSIKLLKQLGISDRLREPKEGEDRGRFITFKQKELKADGSANAPIKVIDAKDPEAPWSGALIGNGSDVDVKFAVKDYGKGKKKGVYIRAVRVLSLVPYAAQEFAPLDEDDEFFAAPVGGEAAPDFEKDFELESASSSEDADDLDDDIPE